MLRTWCKNILVLLLAIEILPAFAEDAALRIAPNCVRMIKQFSGKTVDTWRIDNAQRDEGYIQYSFVGPHFYFPRFHLWVNSYKGMRDRNQPGVGKALLRWVRSQYPEVVIGGLMAGKNFERIEKDILARPSDPDLSRVPFIEALGENFSLHPDFSIVNGRIMFGAPTLFAYPGHSPEPVWLNRQILVENPLYWQWVEQELQIDR